MGERGLRKSRVGVIVSDKMTRSVVVEVRRTVQHRLYNKYIQKRARFLAHDENDTYKVGDKVRIIETRPLSKRKRWRVQEKVT
jgi:small subunit ribosomal protein S17